MTLKGWFLECTDKYLTEPPTEQTDNEGKVITECNNYADKCVVGEYGAVA